VPDLERQVAEMHRAGKIVAFHAGERDPEDVDAALTFQPDLLIHCTHATEGQIRRIADEGIPVAVCPRPTGGWGGAGFRSPPVSRMVAAGCTLLLGTDNVMVAHPDLWRRWSSRPPCTSPGAGDPPGGHRRGRSLWGITVPRPDHPARIVAVDPGRSGLAFTQDPVATLVKRVSAGDIRETFLFSPRE